MEQCPILSTLTFLPLAGVALIALIRCEKTARWIALLTSLAVFALSLCMYARFDGASAEFQLVESHQWLPGFNIAYKLGVDGISVFFLLLSTLLTPICVLASWESVQTRVREYMSAFLILETTMLGMFASLDLVLFYVFFEAVLIPMYLIIGIWGGKRRVYAAFKFFLYTLLGSVLLLLAILALYSRLGTTDIPTLMNADLPLDLQKWLWLAFFASFAVKVPMWPVHTWLPDAHVEAPTAGSVILAGVLLKMGGYGFLRLSLPILPQASEYFTPLIFSLSVIAVIYTSLVALVQEDMKKLIAYSSIAHMGFVTIGLFTVTTQGLQGAMFQMLSHGVVSAALFLCVGVIYDRLHTREIARYGGIVRNMPKYATLFMIFMLASVGLPGTSGFVGEFLVLLGAYRADTLVAFLAATGLVLGAAYMLYLYKRVVFGAADKPDAAAMPDVNCREIAVFLPLVVLTIWMGVYPSTFISPMAPALEKVVARFEAPKPETVKAPEAPKPAPHRKSKRHKEVTP